MSAAVLRPNLFDHLFASRPSRDQNSISATLYSVGIHASLILLAAWLSVALDPMPGKPTDDSVTPIYIAIPPQLITEPAGASPEGSGSSAPVYVVPSVPIPGMPDLPHNAQLSSLSRARPQLSRREATNNQAARMNPRELRAAMAFEFSPSHRRS